MAAGVCLPKSSKNSIFSRHLHNQVPGLEPRIAKEHKSRFTCYSVSRSLALIMVSWAGEPKGSPGSLVSGSSNPAQLTTSRDWNLSVV
ncbi:hypothetical protein DT73_04370 [Mangrovibacter sp. MFB070]|nr:hypothetical protein DT73_04370 [Mangrovibacter sp. MFB070]